VEDRLQRVDDAPEVIGGIGVEQGADVRESDVAVGVDDDITPADRAVDDPLAVERFDHQHQFAGRQRQLPLCAAGIGGVVGEGIALDILPDQPRLIGRRALGIALDAIQVRDATQRQLADPAETFLDAGVQPVLEDAVAVERFEDNPPPAGADCKVAGSEEVGLAGEGRLQH
jgi:hypothetical protein